MPPSQAANEPLPLPTKIGHGPKSTGHGFLEDILDLQTCSDLWPHPDLDPSCETGSVPLHEELEGTAVSVLRPLYQSQRRLFCRHQFPHLTSLSRREAQIPLEIWRFFSALERIVRHLVAAGMHRYCSWSPQTRGSVVYKPGRSRYTRSETSRGGA